MVEIVVSQQPEQQPDHERRLVLDKLRSKFSGEGDEQTSPSSSSSELQCPKVPMKLLPDGVKGDIDHNVPERISLGPYHRGLSHLAGGENLKLKLAKAFINEFDLSVEKLNSLICNDVGDLKVCYEPETAKKFTDADFKVMMLVDGCALLWYIICVCLGLDHEDYDIRYQDLSLLHKDALLLENQLPYQLLQLLMKSVPVETDSWTVIFQEFFGMIDESSFQEFFGIKEKPFLQKIKDSCCQLFFPVIQRIKGSPEAKPEDESNPCDHLLDLYRRNFLGDDERSNRTHRKKKIREKEARTGQQVEM